MKQNNPQFSTAKLAFHSHLCLAGRSTTACKDCDICIESHSLPASRASWVGGHTAQCSDPRHRCWPALIWAGQCPVWHALCTLSRPLRSGYAKLRNDHAIVTQCNAVIRILRTGQLADVNICIEFCFGFFGVSTSMASPVIANCFRQSSEDGMRRGNLIPPITLTRHWQSSDTGN